MKVSILAAAAVIAAAIVGVPSGMAQSRGMAKVVAHRGHWMPSGSAQNSVRSLVKADSINCFGSEFDVWQTSDGVLVVNHDRKVGDIVIEESPSETVLAIDLKNGEKLPRLSDFLDAAKTTDLRLVCELKEHKDKSREASAVKGIVKMMADKGLSHRVDYITFSKDGMLNLIKEAPAGTAVYYLEGDMSPAELKAVGAAGLDYDLKTMQSHPEWIKEAHDLGLKVNIWTVNDEAGMQWCIDNGADFITTNFPERLLRLQW